MPNVKSLFLSFRSLAIIPNSLNRTTQHRFFTRSEFFLRERLFVNKRITIGVGAAKVFRRRIATHIAVDARRIDVVGAGQVFFHAIVSIRQSLLILQDHPQITQITQI